MENAVIWVGAFLLIGAVAYYIARFVSEYRKIRRDIDRIRATGRSKSVMRQMRRDIATGRKKRK